MRHRHKITATCYDKRGRVLSKGENSYDQSHPAQALYAKRLGEPYKIWLHAEIQAIIRAKGKPVHKIKVARYNRKGEPMNACPCQICQLAIKEAGIKLVEYTV